MKIQRLISGFALPSLIIAAVIFASSCRPMITPEQLLELKELRQKEKSLTEQIKDEKSGITKIQAEVDARKSELKKCSEDSDYIKQKLSQWPNVWPDWQPEQAKTEEPEK